LVSGGLELDVGRESAVVELAGPTASFVDVVSWVESNIANKVRRENVVRNNSLYVDITFAIPSTLSSTQLSTIHSRPGILVLINDADWELCGGDSYSIQDNDEITLISTLHGG